MAAILFDIDGVLYQDNAIINGAIETIRWCRDAQIPHLFLTNTTSKPRSEICKKLRSLGIAIDLDELLTPPLAAARWLKSKGQNNIALFIPPATKREFQDFNILDINIDQQVVDAVIIGDMGDAWDFKTLNSAFRLLMNNPSTTDLFALGMTRYWQAPDGLRLDTAPFVVALEHATQKKAQVFGKPDALFFRSALNHLGIEAEDCFMIGDDIRSDIDGAQAAGIKGILVKTGKFRTADLESGIKPFAVLESVYNLQAWWAANKI